MASSGAMMAQTFSSIIPPSLEMAIAPYRKGTRSNSKLFRGRKARKRQMSPRPLAEAKGTFWPAERALCRPFLILKGKRSSRLHRRKCRKVIALRVVIAIDHCLHVVELQHGVGGWMVPEKIRCPRPGWITSGSKARPIAHHLLGKGDFGRGRSVRTIDDLQVAKHEVQFGGVKSPKCIQRWVILETVDV